MSHFSLVMSGQSHVGIELRNVCSLAKMLGLNNSALRDALGGDDETKKRGKATGSQLFPKIIRVWA
ncbi:hypothetical protein [Yersinia vastinensis]|uniref:hypothetical protein n=1 Tax=Yersinia vastinensis TaxID=2890318 RepID=UPI000B12D270|nr:hypothetical protein [Yersinia vastinensis]